MKNEETQSVKLINVKASALRRLAKQNGRRVSKEFLAALDRYIEQKVILACAEHNGGKKTLDAALAAYFLGPRT